MRVLRVDSWQVKKPLASRGCRGETFKPGRWVVLSRSTGPARKERKKEACPLADSMDTQYCVSWQQLLACTILVLQVTRNLTLLWLVTTAAGPAGSGAVGPSWKVPPESSSRGETRRFSCSVHWPTHICCSSHGHAHLPKVL
jgi:hypothetical protein